MLPALGYNVDSAWQGMVAMGPRERKREKARKPTNDEAMLDVVEEALLGAPKVVTTALQEKQVPGRRSGLDGATTDVERVEGNKSNPISSSITLLRVATASSIANGLAWK